MRESFPLRVLYVSGVGGVARRCRVEQPMQQLALAGVHSAVRVAGEPGLFQDVLDFDAFIFHRVWFTSFMADLLDLIRLRGGLSVYETDDLVFRPDLVERDSIYRLLPVDERRLHAQRVALQHEMLAHCDMALT